MSVADRLKIARESTGKSQREMADQLGTSFRAWQDYEAGKNFPGGKVFESLVKMGFNANWLLTGEGEMRRGDKPSEEDKRLREQYPLSPLTAKAFGISDSQGVAYVGQKDHPYAWFHQWIDEELKGKNITEVMRLAVKIKAEIDNEREG